ncbi:hypothetical protein A6V25_30965 [Nostoc sp. ATCC 53789]|nr:hypothetical protein A6V25_30965 [Nostoc sp. ATCC 53789]
MPQLKAILGFVLGFIFVAGLIENCCKMWSAFQEVLSTIRLVKKNYGYAASFYEKLSSQTLEIFLAYIQKTFSSTVMS